MLKIRSLWPTFMESLRGVIVPRLSIDEAGGLTNGSADQILSVTLNFVSRILL